MILVSFEANYADEFDVFGLKVFKNDQAWREYLNEWKEKFKKQISDERLKEFFEVETNEELESALKSFKEEFEADGSFEENYEGDLTILLLAEGPWTEVEWYFGTNEFIIFNSWSEFRDCFEIVTEDENAIKTLTKTWYGTEKGHFPS